MKFQGLKARQWFPLIAAALYCAPLALAENVFTPGAATEPGAKGSTTTPEKKDDENSMLRGYTWESSFDKAGDASKDAAKALKENTRYDCTTLTGEQKVKCDQANLTIAKNAKAAAEEAAGIRDMQYHFADASRLSDIAAVGAIGATGYAHMIKRDTSQAESLNGAASIQETAGYVSYASGAADISMGAYALAMQQRQLENIKEKLSGKAAGLNMQNPALMSKISKAAEETKKAAYSHMMYGAGKVAVGYASMHLAKKNREQAANMESLVDLTPTANPYQSGIAATNNPTFSANSGAAPYYQNSNPQFVLPTGSSTSSTNSGSTAPATTGSSGGASVMPSPEFRGLASAGSKGGLSAGTSSGGGGSGGSGSAATADEKAEDAAAEAAKAKAAEGMGQELNLGGGNGSRYGGGSSSDKDEGGGVADLLGGMLGANTPAAPASNATGLNPNSLYRDATEDLSGNEQGSMAGVSGSGTTLFQVVKTKYNKMMEVGRLARPGTVEVRN